MFVFDSLVIICTKIKRLFPPGPVLNMDITMLYVLKKLFFLLQIFILWAE